MIIITCVIETMANKVFQGMLVPRAPELHVWRYV